jgi:hypothetical protein
MTGKRKNLQKKNEAFSPFSKGQNPRIFFFFLIFFVGGLTTPRPATPRAKTLESFFFFFCHEVAGGWFGHPRPVKRVAQPPHFFLLFTLFFLLFSFLSF